MTDSAKPAWSRLHLWQIQLVRDVAVLTTIVLLLKLGYALRLVTVPMLLALLLAYLFEPVVRRMTKRAWLSRSGAAVLIIAVATALVLIPVTIGVTYGAVQGVGFVREVAANTVNVMTYIDRRPAPIPIDVQSGESGLELPEEVKRAKEEADRAFNNLSNNSWRSLAVTLSKNIDKKSGEYAFVREAIFNNSKQILTATVGTGTEAVARLLRGVISLGVLAFTGFLTAFFFFFFSTGYDKVVAFFKGFIHKRNKPKALDLIKKMDKVVAGFVRGRLTICAIQCMVFSIGYLLIGVPAAFVLGICVGVLSIVPYLALISVPISILLLWLDPPSGFRGEWWWIVGAPVVFYFVAQMFDDYVLTPKIQGKNTGMDAPAVLFASMAGGILAGPYGLLIAIPVAACVKILLIEVFWPKFRAWTEGKAADPLPIAGDAKTTSAS